MLLSSIVTPLFCNSLPVVLSNRAIALSVEEAGHTTSPPEEGKFVRREPSTAGSLAVPSSFTIWFAPVPLFSVNTGVVVPVATPMSALAELTSVTVPVPLITKSPEPRSVFPLIVFMLVPETRVACLVASHVSAYVFVAF